MLQKRRHKKEFSVFSQKPKTLSTRLRRFGQLFQTVRTCLPSEQRRTLGRDPTLTAKDTINMSQLSFFPPNGSKSLETRRKSCVQRSFYAQRRNIFRIIAFTR